MNRKLFGTGGIRGILGKTITTNLFYTIGNSLADITESDEICIAHDTRTSGPAIVKSLSNGIMDTGCNVTLLGLLPTPALNYITKERFDAGIMVTASHNPPEYNGVKICDNTGLFFGDDKIQQLESRIFNGRTIKTKRGLFREKQEMKNIYIDELNERINIENEFKVVVDPGNGSASELAPTIFSGHHLKIYPLNAQPDGNFPSRSPEPKIESLLNTYKYLVKTEADLAIAFDGDADRVVFLDKDGFIGYNEPISFISTLKCSEKSNNSVVTTVETGRLIDLMLEECDVKVIRTRVGDAFVANEVKNTDSCIGVEQVGVYIMPEMGYYPDSIYTVLYLLSKIDQVSEIREKTSQYTHLHFSKSSVECREQDKKQIMQRLEGNLSTFDYEHVNLIDGIRFEFTDSWLLIRPSGTEPIIRLICESENKTRMNELIKKGRSLVELCKQ